MSCARLNPWSVHCLQSWNCPCAICHIRATLAKTSSTFTSLSLNFGSDGMKISVHILNFFYTALTGSVIEMLRSVSDFNTVPDCFWQFLSWKTRGRCWWEHYAQPEVYLNTSGSMKQIWESDLEEMEFSELNWKCMHVERWFKDMMIYQYFLYGIINLCFVTLTLIFFPLCRINTILVTVVFILCDSHKPKKMTLKCKHHISPQW